MCGLTGWSFTNRVNVTKTQMQIIIAILASQMQARGSDAYGFYRLDSGEITKEVGAICRNLRIKQLQDSRACMIHTRHGTSGANTQPNAHPWRFGSIVGMHNGIVSNYWELKRKHKREDFDVDSMHIFAHLSEGKPLSEIEGYGAVTYLDESIKEHTPNKYPGIQLARFNNGQLSIWGIGKGPNNCDGIIWASTEGAVETALAMADIKAFPYKVEEGRCYWINDGMLWHKSVPFDRFSVSRTWVKYHNNSARGAGVSTGNPTKNTGGTIQKVTRMGGTTDNFDDDFTRRRGVFAYTDEDINLQPYWGYTNTCYRCEKSVADLYDDERQAYYCMPCHKKIISAGALDDTDEIIIVDPSVEDAFNCASDTAGAMDRKCSVCGLYGAAFYSFSEDDATCSDCVRDFGVHINDLAVYLDSINFALGKRPEATEVTIEEQKALDQEYLSSGCDYCAEDPPVLLLHSIFDGDPVRLCRGCVTYEGEGRRKGTNAYDLIEQVKGDQAKARLLRDAIATRAKEQHQIEREIEDTQGITEAREILSDRMKDLSLPAVERGEDNLPRKLHAPSI